MNYDQFYHKVIQPTTTVHIVNRLNQEIFKGMACYILDSIWNSIKLKQLLMASINLDTNEMVIMLDTDYCVIKKRPNVKYQVEKEKRQEIIPISFLFFNLSLF